MIIRLQKIKSFALLGLQSFYTGELLPKNTGYKMYPFIPACLKSDPDIIIKILDNSPRLYYEPVPQYIINLRESIKDRAEIIAKLNVNHIDNYIMIGNMCRNHPEKRKQMFAINGSLIRDFKIDGDCSQTKPIKYQIYFGQISPCNQIYGTTLVIVFSRYTLKLLDYVIVF